MSKGPILPKKKKGQPPPVDKLLKPAIGIALALVAYQFFRGLGSGVGLSPVTTVVVSFARLSTYVHANVCSHCQDGLQIVSC